MYNTDWQAQVIEFHQKFRPKQIGETPAIRHDLIDFRLGLIKEEYKELKDALLIGDLVETADALADLLYVVIGTGVAFGIDLRPVFSEVHRSNMTKSIEGGRADGKVSKGPEYSPPIIRGVLLAQDGTLPERFKEVGP